MVKEKRGGRQGTLKLNIQLFARKRTRLYLPPKEYGKVIREIDDLYYDKYKNKKTFYHFSGDYMYEVQNISFNQYIITSKEKI